MRVKSIFILFFLLQFVFSESNYSIQLNNKKALRFSFGISQWEDNDNIGSGEWISYISKPINIWVTASKSNDGFHTEHIGVSHLFFINDYAGMTLGFSYWDWDDWDAWYWSGPNRETFLGFTSKFESQENTEYFWDIGFSHINTNSSYWESIYTSIVMIYSIKNFTITPWLSIDKSYGYSRYSNKKYNWDSDLGVGISFGYNLPIK